MSVMNRCLPSSSRASCAQHAERCISTKPSTQHPSHQRRMQAVVCRATDESPLHLSPQAPFVVPHQPVTTRRDTAFLALYSTLAAALPGPAAAAGFNKTKKRKLTEEDYVMSEDVGLRIVELEEGSGNDRIKPGDRATVHYDCTFRGIDAVSSRAARLLGGNRIIAEPYEFVVGEPVLGVTLKKAEADGGNGLFSGTSGPKPPQALSRAVVGMKRGGKRSILVDDPDLGYPKGMMEIPAGATFELKVEVLSFAPRSA